MRDRDVLRHFISTCHFKQALGDSVGPAGVSLPQPVFDFGGMQSNIITPAKPRIALKDVAHFVKRGNCFLAVPCVRVIDAQIDQRIGFSLKHLTSMAQFQSLLIELQRAFEILKLAMNPSDAVRNAWIPEQVSVAAGPSDPLMKSRQRFRPLSEVSPRNTQAEQPGQQQETI